MDAAIACFRLPRMRSASRSSKSLTTKPQLGEARPVVHIGASMAGRRKPGRRYR